MNYYEILKVSRNASEKEIKTSYKSLVKKYHPDVYAADKDFAERKIKEINEAYEVLSNPETRLEYDRYLEEMSQSAVYNAYRNDSGNTVNQHSESMKSNGGQDAFSQFIFNKFDKLTKKTQIKIFIIGLMIILFVLLVNIIKMKNYLTRQNDLDYVEEPNIVDDDYYDNYYNYYDDYNYDYYYYNYSEEDLEELNEIYNNLIQQYMNMYKESANQFE